MYYSLPYDTAAYETSSLFPKGLHAWSLTELRDEFEERLRVEKEKTELIIPFYRVGFTMSFQLPVTDFPNPMPPIHPDFDNAYVWSVWHSWHLRERWSLLHTAWRQFEDAAAGTILQQELAAISNWHSAHESTFLPAHLATAHVATCLAVGLKERAGWDPTLYELAKKGAEKLLEGEVRSLYRLRWENVEQLELEHLYNIPCMVLLGAALLADVIGHPDGKLYEQKSRLVLTAWHNYTIGEERHSESTVYDGLMLEMLVDWLQNLPDASLLYVKYERAFRMNLDAWLHQLLPGRLDMLAPLGDVEPEMCFWMTASIRMTSTFSWPDGAWLSRRLPLRRLPAAALAELLLMEASGFPVDEEPASISAEHTACATLRTGWDSSDTLVAIALSRNPFHHLHYDNGHVVIGREGRFWITDPGYQQYRSGAERDYTIGIQAHNAPMIGGKAQTLKDGVLHAHSGSLASNDYRSSLELTKCYELLPVNAKVMRDIRLQSSALSSSVIVRDRFSNLEEGTKLDFYWLGGAQLAWAFTDGWVRLSDGQGVLWIGLAGEVLDPQMLERHEGSRGPLMLHLAKNSQYSIETLWWIFAFDDKAGWQPPIVYVENERFKINDEWINL